MPQMFVAASSTPDPYAVQLAASGQLSVHVQADVSLTWSDATAGTIPAIIGAAGNVAGSAYGGTSVDNAADTYYLLALKGAAVPMLLKEKDIDAADTILSGPPTWGKVARIANGIIYPTPQP